MTPQRIDTNDKLDPEPPPPASIDDDDDDDDVVVVYRDDRTNNTKEMHKGDYKVVQEIYDDHSRMREKAGLGVAPLDVLHGMGSVRRDDPFKRVVKLAVPKTSGGSLPESLSRLSALESLEMERCDRIPEWIGGLTTLRSLRVVLLDGRVLPESVTDLVHLEELQVICTTTNPHRNPSRNRNNNNNTNNNNNNNKPPSIFPKSMAKLTNLKRLLLTIEHPPNELGDLKNLEELHLGHETKSLPPSIGNLSNLKTLVLWASCLQTLPDEIGNCTGLESLYLEASAIESLPSSIGNLTNLRDLNLRSTSKLKHLPDELGSLQSLERLDLRWSKAIQSKLPATTANLSNLRVVSLGEKYLHDPSNQSVLKTLVSSCPRLGCLDYGLRKVSDPNILRERMAICENLLRNKVRVGNSIHHSAPSLWPAVLERAHVAMDPRHKRFGAQGSKVQHQHQQHQHQHQRQYRECWCCGKRSNKHKFDRADATFRLLVHYGATILESRTTATTTTITTPNE